MWIFFLEEEKRGWRLNLMQCGDGPDHGREKAGAAAADIFFAFQMKANLKLRHGLLNIWRTSTIK